MCNNRVKQHLILLHLGSVSINKSLVTKFTTVIVSWNLNLMQSLSTLKSTTWVLVFKSNRMFGTKHLKTN